MQKQNINSDNYSVTSKDTRITLETATQIPSRIHPQNDFRRFTELEIEQTVAQCFESRVEQYPDCLAVQDHIRSLTYREFNALANQIAHGILALRGEGSEQVVLFFEQGINFLAGIFGVLKTGKCYVPIDPSFPETRNRYILENSEARLIVTNSANWDAATHLAGDYCPLLNIDTLGSDFSPENPSLNFSPDALAYIIYTSGSTGKPKGVFQNNRNLLHNAMNQINAFHLGVGDRMPLVHSCSVMGAVRVIYNALLSGTTLYPFDVKAEGLDALRSLLIEEKITVFHSVATLFRHFAEIFRDADAFPHLRLVILGGEAMTRKDVEFYKQYFPDNCLLCTGLGSTEAGTIRVFMLDKSVEITTAIVPPGYGVDGVEVLLWDEDGRDVPPGEVGEIVIQSAYLAMGYWQQDDTNAQTFVPIAPGSPVRRFRTGDLGMFLPDGCLVHMGRKDFQVKIRGYRVNVAEIEAALMDYGFLKEVAVIGRELEPESTPGELSLVAYIVSREQPAPTVSELRQFLATLVPQYMIPARFMTLDALPQTPNGKIDRRSLPNPEPIAPATTHPDHPDYVAPRTPLELELAQIWANLLKLPVERVGISDSFLELGGNSLRGMQLVARLGDRFGISLTPLDLFQNPTVKSLAALIEPLLGQESGGTLISGMIAKIPQRGHRAPAPLSYSQQRLWVFEQLEPGSSTYVVTKALQFEGHLDIPALQKALDTLVKRHEILRTVFLEVLGEPCQMVQPPRAVAMPLVDLSDRDAASQEALWHEMMNQEDHQPFNLQQDLMLRAKLVRFGPNQHRFLLVRHHLACDGWSLGVIWQELSELYTAFHRQTNPQLPALEIQFADFATWERQMLSGNVLEQQLSYWQRQLQGSPALLQLPTDRPRPPVQTYKGRTETIVINPELTAQVQEFNRRHNTTLFMTLVATFFVLLGRYSCQNDVLLGSMIANRNQRETEPLLGFFSNLLVLRANLEENPSFEEFLAQVQTMALEAFAYKDVPFEQLTATLKPQRSASHTPWFQVLFLMQNFPLECPQFPGVATTVIPIDESAKYDLTLTVTETEEGLRTAWAYNTDLFDPITIERMATHFQVLLEGAVNQPSSPILQLPLLSQTERQQLLSEQNQQDREIVQQLHIVQQFEAQAAKTPDKIALFYEKEILTYQSLNERSNQLSHYLQSLGVKTGILVGLCLHRSLDMVVAMMAVLKSGAAYVPIDPRYPQERREYVLENAQISILLTQASLVARLQNHRADSQPHHGYQLVVLDEHPAPEQMQPKSPLSVVIQPEDLAYVIYTSGSTGKPKGVQVTHRGVANFLASMIQLPGLESRDRVLAITTIAFDIAVLEIFAPLMVGASVIIATEAVAADGDQLLQVLSSQQITLLQATPATWRMLLAVGWEGSPTLKMLCGGEALSRELANRLLVLGASLWNMYGPTETTVWSAVDRVQPGSDSIYLGFPIANTQFYVLDSYQQPVPLGVPGELYIGGDGLARGYLHRPDLTAERFIPHPFATETGKRLYRTGDRVRYRPDGNLEFLGRVDFQVKIRGFRIELGEIESVLRQHPDLAEVVLLAREDQPGDQRLVAYVMPKEGCVAPSLLEMRQFLQKQLPDYMLPAAFVVLETLPLTPNGKVDRRALPKPDLLTLHTHHNFVAPRSDLESQISELWGQILGQDRVGIEDNFFELGGHSLLAIQLVSQINQKLGLDISLMQLFQNPTVSKLCENFEQSYQGADTKSISALVPLKTTGTKPPLFVINSTGQARVFAMLLDEDQPTYSLNMFSIRPHLENFLTEANNPSYLKDLLPTIASYFLTSLKQVQPQGPYYLFGYCQDGPLTIEVAQQLRQQGDEVAQLYLLDSTFKRHRPQFHHRLYSLYNIGLPYFIESLQRFSNRYLLKNKQFSYRQVIEDMSTKARMEVLEEVPKDQLLYALYLSQASQYQLQPYDSLITLLLSSEWQFADRTKLEQCAVGGLHIKQVKAAHRKIFQEPYVRELATYLMTDVDARISGVAQF